MHISSDDLRYYAESRDRRVSAKTRRRQALADTFAQAISDEELTVAVPSGKSLEIPVLGAFERSGIHVKREYPRQCLARVEGFPFLHRAAFCTPSVIPSMISSGAVPFGFTGSDNVREFDDYDSDTEEQNSTLTISAEFPLSKSSMEPTRAVMFVCETDSIQNMEGLVAAVGHERPINVVTEYPSSTIDFLWKYGLRANLLGVRGGAETFVALKQYRLGVALTETGITLKQNGLRVIGELFQSKTALVVNRAFLDFGAGQEIVRRLVERMQSACTP